MQDLSQTLKQLQNDKIPCLDNFPIEFSREFQNIMGEDLLKIIEESRE